MKRLLLLLVLFFALPVSSALGESPSSQVQKNITPSSLNKLQSLMSLQANHARLSYKKHLCKLRDARCKKEAGAFAAKSKSLQAQVTSAKKDALGELQSLATKAQEETKAEHLQKYNDQKVSIEEAYKKKSADLLESFEASLEETQDRYQKRRVSLKSKTKNKLEKVRKSRRQDVRTSYRAKKKALKEAYLEKIESLNQENEDEQKGLESQKEADIAASEKAATEALALALENITKENARISAGINGAIQKGQANSKTIRIQAEKKAKSIFRAEEKRKRIAERKKRLEELKNPDLEGRVSYFGGGGDYQPVASGGYSDRPGLALNLKPGTDSGWNNATTQKWMTWAREGRPMLVRVRTQGKEAVLPVIDVGPAGFTGRAIDITEAGLKKLGFKSSSEFRTDAGGKAYFLGRAKK